MNRAERATLRCVQSSAPSYPLLQHLRRPNGAGSRRCGLRLECNGFGSRDVKLRSVRSFNKINTTNAMLRRLTNGKALSSSVATTAHLKGVPAKPPCCRGSENGQLIAKRKGESAGFTSQPRPIRKKEDYKPRTWAAQTTLRSRCWSTRTARYREQVAISAFAQLAMEGTSRPNFCTTA